MQSGMRFAVACMREIIIDAENVAPQSILLLKVSIMILIISSLFLAVELLRWLI